MHLKSTLVALCALPLVASCGSNGTGSTSGLLPSQHYAAAFTDGESTIYDKLTTTGLTGFVGNSDGTVSEILVRVDLEAEVVYASMDGGPEVIYDEVDEIDLGSSSGYLELFNAAGKWIAGEYYSGEPAYVELGDEGYDYSEGYIGLETAAASLPSGAVTYSGSWGAQGYTETSEIGAGGEMLIGIDFASGDLNGFTRGGYGGYDSEEGSFGGELGAIIEGTVEGSRLAATMSFFGETTGEMDMMGAIYGEDGEFAAGGVGGTLNTAVGPKALGGDFQLYGSEGCGIEC